MWLLSLIHSNIDILIILRPRLVWTTTIVHLLFLWLHYIMQKTLGLNLHYTVYYTTLHLFIVLVQIKWQNVIFFPTARDHNMLTLLSTQCMNNEIVEWWLKYIILQGCACEWAGWAKMMQYIQSGGSPFCFLLFCSLFIYFLPEFCFHVVFPRGPLSVTDLPTFFLFIFIHSKSVTVKLNHVFQQSSMSVSVQVHQW